MKKNIILDIETTGLNIIDNNYKYNKIIEIAAIEIKNRKITNNIFHTYLNPIRKIDPISYKIHNINNKFLKNKPIFKNIYKNFIKFIKNSNLIIHNSKFDIKFIQHELNLININIKINEICNIIDTLLIARKKFPGKKNNLNSLCKRYKINILERKYHGALIDAKLLAHLYLNMTRQQITLKSFLYKPKNLKNNLIKKKYNKIIKYNINKNTIKLHNKYLQYIKKKYKKCIWLK